MSSDKSDIRKVINSEAGIKQMLTDTQVSRRDFLTYTGALGMSVAMGSSLWSNKAMASTPIRGGHMKAGIHDMSTTNSLDPTTYNNTANVIISRTYRDALVEINQDSVPSGALAESWEASPDAKTWRFNIRKGVEFSNGKTFTVEDAVNSINVHRGEDSPSGAKGILADIQDVKADGDAFVVELGSPNANAPFLFTDYHMMVVPTVDGKADLNSQHGTGCYKLDSYEAGIKATFSKNPNAWQGDEFGYADSVEIIGILDETARQSALISGTVDVISKPALKTLDRLKKVNNIEVSAIPSNFAHTNPMRMDTAPFDNNNLRLAIKHSLPRQEFIDKILAGYGAIGNDQPIGPQSLSYDASITVDYDLDKAKFHLKKAGMEGTKIELSASDAAYGGAVDAAQLFQQHWAKIGLNAEIIREPADGYWSNVWNKKAFCACVWSARPVEDMILSSAYLSTAPWNDTVFKNSRVDELIVSARGELDDAKRNAMYREIQQIISTTGGQLIPAFGNDLAAYNSAKIGVGPKIGGGWEMDGGFFAKRWWVKA